MSVSFNESDDASDSSDLIVRRMRDMPVISSGIVDGYGPIFNPGLLHHEGRYHLFARGVRFGYRLNPDDGPRFLDYISDILVFESLDGVDYSFAYVLVSAGEHAVHCYEDPRVQRVMSTTGERIVMTYTNLPSEESGMPWRIGAHELRWDGERFHVVDGSGRLLGPEGMENKDAVIFNLADGRAALMHRLPPNMQLAVFDDFEALWDADDSYWVEHLAEIDTHTVIRPAPAAFGVGAGAPPIATEHGLILFFHERNADGVYTMNVALLDLDHGRPVAILPAPLLVPELPWEIEGDVDGVVFVQGAHRVNETMIYVAYGAADRCIGSAVVLIKPLLAALAHEAAVAHAATQLSLRTAS